MGKKNKNKGAAKPQEPAPAEEVKKEEPVAAPAKAEPVKQIVEEEKKAAHPPV